MSGPNNCELAKPSNCESDNKKYQYLAAYLATLSAMSVGTCLAWTSPSIPLMVNVLHILTPEQSSWVGSIYNVGGFVGALFAGYLVIRLGRKWTLIVISIPLIISWILISACVSSLKVTWAVSGLYIARVIGGISSGVISVAAPMYVSEVAESSVRGTLGTFYQLQITIGILYGYIVGLANHELLISLLCGLLPFMFVATFMFLPESPTYLLSTNRTDEAKHSLQWFRGPNFDVQHELSRLQEQLDVSRENRASVIDILSDFVIVKALFIILGLMVFQQLSGVNAVIFYTSTIFQSAGSSLSANYASIIIGFVQVVATYCSTLLIEKAGRRVLLLLSAIVMAICLAILGAYFHLQEEKVNVSNYSWVPLLSLAIFIVVFSLGFGPIPWIIMGELVPSNLKGFSSALAAGCSWLLAFNVTYYFGDLVNTFGEAITFWGFSVICVVGAMFVAALLPETKGKDIQMILEELGRKRSNVHTEQTKVPF